MICKYCGAVYTGKQCGSCGKVTPLVKRSVGLDVLMSGEETTPSGTKAPAGHPAGSKTYDQGMREGYQKGLREGYQNGLKDGRQNAAPAPAPSPGETHKKASRPMINTRILAAAAAAVLAVGGALGGVIGGSTGRNAGIREGKTQAEAAFQARIEAYETKISDQDAALAEAAQKAEENTAAISSLEEQVSQQAEAIQAYEEKEAASAQNAESVDARIQKAREEGEAAGRKKAEKERYDEAYKAGKTAGEESGRAQGTEEGYRAGHDFALTLSFPYSRKRDGDRKDPAVLWIQKQLNAVNRRKIAEDGIYGSKTVAAVRAFQKSRGLPETGEVDQATYFALFDLPLPANAPEGDNTDGKLPPVDPADGTKQADDSNPVENESADPADGANDGTGSNPGDEPDLHQEDMNPGESVPTAPPDDAESQEKTPQNTQENSLDAVDPVPCTI